MSEIANCPFCGGVAHVGTVRYQDRMVKQQKWSQDTFYHVTCESCGASNVGIVGHRSPEDATAKWNRRTPTDAQPDHADEIAALRQENERLKEALRRIAAASVYDTRDAGSVIVAEHKDDAIEALQSTDAQTDQSTQPVTGVQGCGRKTKATDDSIRSDTQETK